MENLSISPRSFSYKDFAPLFKGPVKVSITKESVKNLKRSRQLLLSQIEAGKIIYGVNTGFGKLSQHSIKPRDQKQLQLNLVRSHASGFGDPLEPGVVRSIFILKLLTYVKGYSGVRPQVANKIIQFLNKDVLPIIPEKGSVGASGDLAPLGHLALAMVGEGSVLYQGRTMSASTAIKKAGIKPLVLHPKEGLSLINGTQVSTALGIKALLDGEMLLKTADIAGALSVENSFSSRNVFNKEIQYLKKHPGQRTVANNILKLLHGSKIVQSHKNCDIVQDPYSFRCIPHIHGASRDSFFMAADIINNEINSVSDNPLVLTNGKIANSGHFHAEHVAQSLDILAIAMSELGAISERRSHYFMKGIDHKIMPFVANNPGLESGYMIPHVVASALVSENKTLAHPASIDSIPTSGGHEDFVSMAPWSGLKLFQIQKNIANILAIELFIAGAANYQASNGIKPGRGTGSVLKFLNSFCRYSTGDRFYKKEIDLILGSIITGELINNILNKTNLE